MTGLVSTITLNKQCFAWRVTVTRLVRALFKHIVVTGTVAVMLVTWNMPHVIPLSIQFKKLTASTPI